MLTDGCPLLFLVLTRFSPNAWLTLDVYLSILCHQFSLDSKQIDFVQAVNAWPCWCLAIQGASWCPRCPWLLWYHQRSHGWGLSLPLHPPPFYKLVFSFWQNFRQVLNLCHLYCTYSPITSEEASASVRGVNELSRAWYCSCSFVYF